MDNFMNWSRFEKIYKIYEKKYDFRFCNISEYDELVDFIDKYWQKGHIFTESKELLDWQHLDRDNGRYNFVIASDKESNEIHGIIGFIMSSIYDYKIKTPIRWGAIWKVRGDVGVKGLGLALKYYFEINAPAKYIGGTGLSNYSKVINGKLGEQIGKLKLYYMLNDNFKEFVLVDNITEEAFNKENLLSSTRFLKEINPESFENSEKSYFKHIPEYKSPLFYVNRYFRHPIYEYKFIEIYNEIEEELACLIVRKCEANNAFALMVVDYIGDGSELAGLHNEFQLLLRKYNAEFISFYEHGLDDNGILSAGFLDKNNSDIIIPLYFEPFVKKHVDLDYHFYSSESEVKTVIFKGDADQDRPNKLPKE